MVLAHSKILLIRITAKSGHLKRGKKGCNADVLIGPLQIEERKTDGEKRPPRSARNAILHRRTRKSAESAKLTEGRWTRGAAVGGAVMQMESGCVTRVSAARALAVNNRRPAASAGRPPKAPPLPQPIGRVGAIEYLPLTTQRWISARHFDIAALRRRASLSRSRIKTPFVFIVLLFQSFSSLSLCRAEGMHLRGSNPGASDAIGLKKQLRYFWSLYSSAADCDTHAQPSRNSFLYLMCSPPSPKTADGSKG